MREKLGAIIYTRVSTGEQADSGTSLAGQLEACLSKAASLGAEVVGVYEDAGVSGALYISRLRLQAALCDLEEGKANCLIIANLSRCSRDIEHQSTIKKRVEAAGARLVFCDMDFAETPEGDFAYGVMGAFSDYEHKVIKVRTMKGRRRRAQEGIQPCRNYSPFGYHVPSNKDVLRGTYPPESLGTYQVIEEQARWAQEIFMRFAGGQSLRGVARWLTESGVPTPEGGSVWNQSTLFRLLQHPVYKGMAPFGRFERRHDENRIQQGYKLSYVLKERPQEQWVYIDAPALIDEATWDACQERMQQNRSLLRGRPRNKYMLTSLLRCPKCGRKMRSYRRSTNPRNKAAAHYYNIYECRFSRPSTNLKGEVCHNKQYRGDWAEPLVTRAIQEVARRPELASAALEAYKRAKASEQLLPDVERLQQQLNELQKQEQATIKAQVAGVMAGADASFYEAMLRGIANKRAPIMKILAQAGQVPSAKDRGGRNLDKAQIVAQAISCVDEALNAPDGEVTPAEKQALLARVIESIHPEGKEGLRIFLKPPLVNDPLLNVQYFTT